jgi:hypothetical protein
VVGAASGVGVRQLTVQGGCTRWRSAWGVVEPIGERLERAVRGGGNGGALGAKGRGGRKGAPRWGCAPFIATRGGGRRRRGGRETVGGETAVVSPWAWARRRPLLSESSRRGLSAVSPRD